MQSLIIPSLCQPGFLCVQASVNYLSRSAFMAAVAASGCHVAALNAITPGARQCVALVVAPLPVNMAQFHALWPAGFN